MWLDVLPEDAVVVVPGAHHDGEVGELVGAVVDVEAVEVVLQD